MATGKIKIVLGISFVVVFTIGFFIGEYSVPKQETKDIVSASTENDNGKEVRQSEGYKFINPLLECDNYSQSNLNTVVWVEQNIKSYIQRVIDEKKATFVSVYFRDLNLGPWMGINEKENFSPASLLKVPIMIAALKVAEKEPGFLKKKIAYIQLLDRNTVPNIKDGRAIKIGNSYTIEDLIERMIADSDNEAKELLLQNLKEDLVLKVMTDIGININSNTAGDFVSVKEYSGCFRLLFNATYLNKDLSEKALSILTKTTFNKGILAGIPPGVTVAHKFGERAYFETDIKQLHECGIVYKGENPYLLCVMTRGNDFEKLTSIIAGISAIVYKEVR